jgi:hypothetical protein
VTDTHLLVEVGSALLFIGMSKGRLASLPPDLQELVRTRFTGPEVAARAAACWQAEGEAVAARLVADGRTLAPLSKDERAVVRPHAVAVTEAYLAELEAKGLPARAFHAALVAEQEKVAAELAAARPRHRRCRPRHRGGGGLGESRGAVPPGAAFSGTRLTGRATPV